MNDPVREQLELARAAGLRARKAAKLARLTHGVERRWADEHGHHGRCRCGHRATASTSLARDQELAHHIAQPRPQQKPRRS